MIHKMIEVGKVEILPRWSGRLSLKQVAKVLKEFRAKLETTAERGHPDWKISQCIDCVERVIALDEAAGLEAKEKAERDFVENIEKICFGNQEATMIYEIYKSCATETLLSDRDMFVLGSLPKTSGGGKGGPEPSDDLFEKYTEVLLENAGCKILGRHVAGRKKNIDLLVSFRRQKFAVECKRARSREKIRRRVSVARDQLLDYCEVHGCQPVIALDGSLPICKIAKEIVTELHPWFESTETQVREQVNSMFIEEVYRDPRNICFNLIGVALTPYFRRRHMPTVSRRLWMSRSWLSKPKSAFDQLGDALHERGMAI